MAEMAVDKINRDVEMSRNQTYIIGYLEGLAERIREEGILSAKLCVETEVVEVPSTGDFKMYRHGPKMSVRLELEWAHILPANTEIGEISDGLRPTVEQELKGV